MIAVRKKMKFKPPRTKPAANKRGRLIIRNLPFSTTEEALRDHFASYGTINDFNLLRKPDGKLVGCGFVQFDRKQSAAKAIHHLNGKPFMGRPIIVDWAISKTKFTIVNKPSKTEEKLEIKDEPLDDAIETSIPKEVSETESEEESASEDEDEEEENELKTEPREEDEPESRPRPLPSHDVNEGKTVFLRNVPFNCTNDELKAFMETIGPVYYAVVCIDPLTEHSKGTAFVKFRNEEDALKCVNNDVELNFKNNGMIALPALHKNDLSKQNTPKHPDKKSDTRNLYLIKEGVIIAGTKAAKDVSMSDMKRRLELEAWKSNILRNLNMFVSRTRLIIHNLPLSYDDKMLRALFKKYAPPKSNIVEAKVMRNMRQLDNNNKPVSKGYGFVSFTKHEDALKTLRIINNNPAVFNKNKRPIVAFSVENRVVHKIKEKRMEKSRLNNSLCPNAKKPKVDEIDSRRTKVKRRDRSENVPTFTGMEAHPSTTIKLMSKSKIASQKVVHQLNVNHSRKETRRKQTKDQIRKEKKRDPKMKLTKQKNRNSDEATFNELVAIYKDKLEVPLKKWYE